MTPRRAIHSHHTTKLLGVLAWVPLLVSASAGCLAAQGMPPSLTQFLQQTISLSPDEMSAVTGGTPVVKLLGPADPREIALVGLVRIDVPRAFYVERAADFPMSLREPSRVSFGIFSDPATVGNVVAFSLPHADAQDLAKCKPGSCMLKLPGQAIVDLSATIDPNSPTADSIASAYFREHMVAYVTAYRARGSEAMVVYRDRPDSDAAAQVWDAMLSRSPYMYQYAPSLERSLRNYPQDRPAGIREVLFWSDDALPQLRPMLTITHEMVYSPPELPGSTLIVSQQLYCDHYLDGGFDLTAIVDQAAASGATPTGIYLVFLRRLHFDYIPSGGLIDIRGTIVSRLRARTMTFLRDAKTNSERAYTASRASSP